jgi:alkylation response protein AidB-like acyl-CoA dehydrogenase
LAGYLHPDVARRIYGGGRTVVAGTLNPSGKAFATDGGYHVTGHWGYGSGIGHSTWTLGVCVVHDTNGPRRGPTGAPELRLVLFPTSAAEVIDTWRVSGLRGTGSHDYRVANLFVPEGYAISFPGATPVQSGTLFAMPLFFGLALAIAAVPLGIARAAIDAVIELAVAKTPQGSAGVLRDKATLQADVGRAEALLGSARAYLCATFRELWDDAAAGISPSMHRRAQMWLACTQAAQSSAQAVDLMYNAGGGTSVYETNRLERCFRDVHACTQHVAISTARYEPCGRVFLGLDPGTPRF